VCCIFPQARLAGESSICGLRASEPNPRKCFCLPIRDLVRLASPIGQDTSHLVNNQAAVGGLQAQVSAGGSEVVLGGEKKKDGEVKRSFKPVNGRGIISYFDSISRGLIVVARINYLGVA
jgi:hypothetical protein